MSRRSILIAASLGLVSASTAIAAMAPTRRFAVIVAENQPRSPNLPPLRFADDDALRYASWFEALGAEVRVLVVADADTQRRHPRAVSAARPPTLEALRDAMRATNAGIDAAHAEGADVDLYFVFSGHGEVGDDGEGRIHLRDATLGRRAFFAEVVAKSRADFNHLIIDACHASALVLRRGAAPANGYRADDYGNLIGNYLDRADLAAHPNTGALLATSRDQETHEWGVFGAGIFSHELRSGMTGPADTNGDGAIEYSEIAAFIASANVAMRARAGASSVVVRPPALDLHRPLVDLVTGPARFLTLPRAFEGRGWLEDATGERYADFHASAESATLFALLIDGGYYLHRGDDEAQIAANTAGTIDGDGLVWNRRTLDRRGAIDDDFRQSLFGVPFGPSFYQGYVAQSGSLPAVPVRAGFELPGVADEVPAEGRETRFGVWPYAAVGISAAAGLGAIWLGLEARRELDVFERHVARNGVDDPAQRDRIARMRDGSNTLTSLAAMGVGVSLTLFLLDKPVGAPRVVATQDSLHLVGQF